RMCDALGLPEMASDADYKTNALRQKHHGKLEAKIEALLKSKPTKHWLAVMAKADIPAGPINNVKQALAHPQVAARNMLVSVPDGSGGTLKLAGNPIKMSAFDDPPTRAPAPDLDADRAAIPSYIGWSGRAFVPLRSWLLKLLAGLVLALAVFVAGTYFQVKGALPPYSGHFEAKGLKAPVEILRDKNAVPHIIAGSIEDAAFGLGFVHAQDRFWQMELMRRLGQGRLSEILPPAIIGNGIVDTDRTMRGLGVYRAASDSVGALSPAVRSMLDACAAGVNAWLADNNQQFGLELTLVKLLSGGRYKPEPWQAAESMVWTKLMALTLDGNWRQELLRLRLNKKVGEDGTNFLL